MSQYTNVGRLSTGSTGISAALVTYGTFNEIVSCKPNTHLQYASRHLDQGERCAVGKSRTGTSSEALAELVEAPHDFSKANRV